MKGKQSKKYIEFFTNVVKNQTMSASKIIQEMKRRIVEKIRPNKIVLFGSYARGKEGPNSDVDLLVILPFQGSKRKKTIEIYRFLAGIGLPKDVIVATPEEIEKYRNIPGTLIKTALQEGQILYEKTPCS